MDAGRYGRTTVGVLTVIQEEFDAVKAALAAPRQRPRTRYWHGEAGHDRFVLAKTADRTSVAAAEATRDMIEHWRPDVVMLVGIAGALSSGDAGLGDVVVPDFVHYGEFRKLTEAGDDLRFAAYDHPSVTLRTDIVEGVRERGEWTGTSAPTGPSTPRGAPRVRPGHAEGGVRRPCRRREDHGGPGPP